MLKWANAICRSLQFVAIYLFSNHPNVRRIELENWHSCNAAALQREKVSCTKRINKFDTSATRRFGANLRTTMTANS